MVAPEVIGGQILGLPESTGTETPRPIGL